MDSKAIIHKTKEDYNRIAELYAATRYKLGDDLKPFKKLVKSGQNILDWGCGNGRLIYLLEDKKVNYFGLDQSIGLLDEAKKQWADKIKSGQVKFFSTASRPKKFSNDFFDLAFLIASFHHLPDKDTRLKLLQKIYKELKPKAKIVITVWNLESDWAKNKFQKDWELMGPNDFIIPWKNNKGEMLAKRYYHHFMPAELKSLLAEAGFKKIKTSYDSNVKFTGKTGRNLIAMAQK